MSDRLSDGDVMYFATHESEGTAHLLAREVRSRRIRYAPIDALCARHGITPEGIVALVDEVFKQPHGTVENYRSWLRRLARQEDSQ